MADLSVQHREVLVMCRVLDVSDAEAVACPPENPDGSGESQLARECRGEWRRNVPPRPLVGGGWRP